MRKPLCEHMCQSVFKSTIVMGRNKQLSRLLDQEGVVHESGASFASSLCKVEQTVFISDRPDLGMILRPHISRQLPTLMLMAG